jgi:hypothetical protein
MKLPKTYYTPAFNQTLTSIIAKSNLLLNDCISTEQVFHAMEEAKHKKLPPDYFCNLHRLCEIVEFLGVCQVEPDGVFDLKIAPPSVYTALLEAMNSLAKIITESNNKVTIQEKIANARDVREKTTNKAINEVAKQIVRELPELWGDLVIDGSVNIESSFDADTLENLIEEVVRLQNEERRSAIQEKITNAQEKITNAREKTTNKTTNLRRVLSLGRRPEK